MRADPSPAKRSIYVRRIDAGSTTPAKRSIYVRRVDANATTPAKRSIYVRRIDAGSTGARSMKLDAASIRSALVPASVLDHFEIAYHEARDELYTRSCPVCGERSHASMCIHAASGVWKCQRCSARGDILALVAGYAQIDIKTQFRRVLEIASAVAGIGSELSPIDRALIEERRRQAKARSELQKQQAAAACERMPATWESLETRNVRGENYLRDRGLDPKELRLLVRYTRDGNPAIPLRDLATGQIVGIQQRNLDPLKPKLLCFRGSRLAGSALHGRLTDLDPDGVDAAVVVEGLADTLAASLAFTGYAIFGAPGASQLPAVVAAVAQRVTACRGCLLLVVDGDDVGVNASVQAVLAAEEVGLRLAPSEDGAPKAFEVRLVRLGKSLDGKPHHDLADAWSRSRWRWTWPST